MSDNLHPGKNEPTEWLDANNCRCGSPPMVMKSWWGGGWIAYCSDRLCKRGQVSPHTTKGHKLRYDAVSEWNETNSKTKHYEKRHADNAERPRQEIDRSIADETQSNVGDERGISGYD